MSKQNDPTPVHSDLRWLDGASTFLDNRFKIPGTNIRFGADFLVGLIPYAGDVISFVISGILVMVMAKKGASGKVLLKMLGNIWMDGVFGTIPILGDLFDLRFRANRRNMALLQEHYEEGKHRGSAWGILLFILIALIFLILISVIIVWKVFKWIWIWIIT